MTRSYASYKSTQTKRGETIRLLLLKARNAERAAANFAAYAEAWEREGKPDKAAADRESAESFTRTAQFARDELRDDYGITPD